MKKLVLMTLLALGSRSGTVCASDASSARNALAAFEARADDWKARMEALVSLAKMDETAVPVLLEAVKKGPPVVRGLAIQALEIFADLQARPALLEALSEDTPGLRAAAVRAMSALGPMDPAQEALRKLLEADPERIVRLAAAWALERDDGSRAAAATREALRAYQLSGMDSARLHEPAPDVSLVEPSGKVHRLSAMRGKKAVVLKFYNEPL